MVAVPLLAPKQVTLVVVGVTVNVCASAKYADKQMISSSVFLIIQIDLYHAV